MSCFTNIVEIRYARVNIAGQNKSLQNDVLKMLNEKNI
jgi:hypothetical protein